MHGGFLVVFATALCEKRGRKTETPKNPNPMSQNLMRLRAVFGRIVLVLGLSFPVWAPSASGQVYEKMFDFGQAREAEAANKGKAPRAAMVQDSDGNFYGTTYFGGANDSGTVFKMTPSGAVTTLVELGNGASSPRRLPVPALVKGSDGNFYGTTEQGGAIGFGTVFKMTPAGVMTTVVEFTGNGASNKGRSPAAALVQSGEGNFYGTTEFGGASNFGTVFKMTPGGVLTTLVEFTSNGASNKSRQPFAALVEGSDGNFYGTTKAGGANNLGTVFKMTPAGVLTTLVEFTGNGASNKGSRPFAGLVQGSDGNFYGTTEQGGAIGVGTVFKMTPTGGVTTLVEFTGNGALNKGRFPLAALVQGSDSNFYGTASNGGANNLGTVFKMTAAGVLTTLVEFTGNGASNKGEVPWAPLIQGSDGSFYGTTEQGGANNFGTVFKMTAAGTLTTLVEFTGSGALSTGSQPYAPLVQGSDGTFYGTTHSGGTFGSEGIGTVFKMTPGGVLTTLVEFGGANKGRFPNAALVEGSDGNLYGTTEFGGAAERGTVFKMTTAGVLTTLVEFTAAGPRQPYAGLVEGSDGNFYGTTYYHGANQFGAVFKMTAEGLLTTLLQFTGNAAPYKGSGPYGALVEGSDGHFYGTTIAGGANGLGTAFKMTPAGVLTTLVEFTGNGAANKGSNPYAGLVQGSDGHFYGTTDQGGANDSGTVFKMSSAGVLTTLVEFGGANKGQGPYASLVEGSDGHFYGTTRFGGANNAGTVFKMTPAGVLTTVWEFLSFSEGGLPMAGLIAAADGNLYGTTVGGDGTVYRLIFPGAPLVVTGKAVTQGGAGAIVEARVNARGAATTVSLEYGTDGANFPNVVPIAINLTGYQTTLVGTTLDALAPGTTYYYRFRAVSSAGTMVSLVASFSTLAEPVVAISLASEIAPTSARFNGTVNARNYNATVTFEWGTDGNSFPNSVPAVPGTVTGNAPVSVSAAVAGLTTGTTYSYRIRATSAGGTAVSGTASFTTLIAPIATVGGSFALTTTSARVNGTVRARNSNASVEFGYSTDGSNFTWISAAPALVTGDAVTPVTADLVNLTAGVTYYYQVRGMSAGGVSEPGGLAQFNLDGISGFLQQTPTAVPIEDRQGGAIVTVLPNGLVGAGWRFAGEQQWRSSGVPVFGLTTSDRVIEFRPVPGRVTPSPEPVTIISGGEATFVMAEYLAASGGEANGGMTITIKPDSLTTQTLPVNQRAQWRLLGENDPQWRDSGTTLSELAPGTYLVEFKPLSGITPARTTPTPISVNVIENDTTPATAIYYLAPTQSGVVPGVLSYDTVTTSPGLPYQWVGQLRSDVGAGSGFVVKAHVVATAAHVVFDDGTLSAATGLQWLFQRDKGNYEPAPQIPRGFHLFTSYAERRELENTPGQSSPVSQNLDAAAVYFLEDAGRGGYSGYLASDSVQNEWLTSSALKTLVGYPTDPAAEILSNNYGRMHGTPPVSTALTKAHDFTYSTTAMRSGNGNSGGPLCVQFEGGAYYPAAIFLGGTGQTVVRAIDSGVLELFKNAEIGGGLGDDQGDGGISITYSSLGSGTSRLTVNLAPSTAQWTYLGMNYNSSVTRTNIITNPVSISFTSVAGYLTPAAKSIAMNDSTHPTPNSVTVTVSYNGITSHPVNLSKVAFGNASFTVGVAGTPLTGTGYQWRRNGVNLSNGVNANGTTISGATARILNLSNLKDADEGNYSVVVTWSNGSLTSNAASLTVQPAPQTISFAALSNRVIGSAPFTLNATATSGLPVSYLGISGPATINGSTVTLTGLGAVTIRARQTGNANYAAATPVDRSFQITLPSIVVPPGGSMTTAGGTFESIVIGAGGTLTLESPPAVVDLPDVAMIPQEMETPMDSAGGTISGRNILAGGGDHQYTPIFTLTETLLEKVPVFRSGGSIRYGKPVTRHWLRATLVADLSTFSFSEIDERMPVAVSIGGFSFTGMLGDDAGRRGGRAQGHKPFDAKKPSAIFYLTEKLPGIAGSPRLRKVGYVSFSWDSSRLRMRAVIWDAKAAGVSGAFDRNAILAAAGVDSAQSGVTRFYDAPMQVRLKFGSAEGARTLLGSGAIRKTSTESARMLKLNSFVGVVSEPDGYKGVR